ncbi:MAG: rRNA pseudouridine synthase [Clostridiaceae bacterium]|nr:rRNA pseudouridine synthase [Clostridiaceae bacterium]
MGTRSEVKKLIRQGRVLFNETPADRPERKVTENDRVFVDGKQVVWEQYEYFMLNKPAGVVSATKDAKDRTVVDLIKCPHSRELFPVGRLDKDTEGLSLLTNDGALAHRLLSPGKHVEKTYFVRVTGVLTEQDILFFQNGIDIGDSTLTKPAVLSRIEKGQRAAATGETVCTELFITITEGRYHQIKRMFAAVGKKVLYLKRVSIGGLQLDQGLKPGEYRRLTEQEKADLCKGNF